MEQIPCFRLPDGTAWKVGGAREVPFPCISFDQAIRYVMDPLTGDPNPVHTDAQEGKAAFSGMAMPGEEGVVIVPGAMIVAVCNSSISKLLGTVLLRAVDIRFRNALLTGEQMTLECIPTSIRPGSTNTRLEFAIKGEVVRNGKSMRTIEGTIVAYGARQ